MPLTIYCLGDIPTFTAILNAVAMVFQSGMMTGPGMGLGAAAGVGLLASMGVMLLAGGAIAMFKGGGGTGNWAMLLVLIVIYSVATQPMTLQIEDYYTGTATTVANVPFGVAVPGALVSSITNAVSTKMEVAFSTVDGNSIALSSDGFASPLQLMLSMRGGKYGLADADPFLAANIKIFVLDCVAGSTTFDPNAFSQQNTGMNNPIAYITQPTVYHGGLTTIYSTGNPVGISSACADAATNLTNSINAFVGPGVNTGISKLLNANMNKAASPNVTVPGTYTADDLTNVHNKMIGIWGASQTAQDWMITALTSAQISDSYNCALSYTSAATYSQCTTTMTSGMENWKIQAAGSASGFTKAMVPCMNILLAMFYGFSPIMFIFMLMTGAHGLGILVKFLFFGMWTQTWMPFAVVINYIGEVMVKAEFARLAAAAPAGLNPAILPAFYDTLSVKLAVISDMLASVPLISMGLLSGSVYGLTQIASNMGKEHIDSKGAAPNLQETGAVTKVGPAGSAAGANDLMSADGTAGHGFSSRTQASGANPFKDVSIQSSGGHKVTEADAHVHSAATTRQEVASDAINHSLTKNDQNGWAEKLGRDVKQGNSSESKAIVSAGAEMKLQGLISESESNKFAGAFAAGLPGGVGGVKAALESSFGTEKAEQIMSALTRSSKNDNSNALSLARNSTQAFSKDFTETLAKSMQVNDGLAFSNANSDLEQAQHQLTSAREQGNSTSVAWSGKSRDLSSLMLQQAGGATLDNANNLISTMSSKLKPEQVAAFNSALLTKQNAGKAQRQFGTGNEHTDATARAAYGLEALGEINPDAMYQFAQNKGLVTSSDAGDGGVTEMNKGVNAAGATAAANVIKATRGAPSMADGLKLRQEVNAGEHNVDTGAVNGQVAAGQKEIHSAQALVKLLGHQLVPTPGEAISPAAQYQQQVESAAKDAGILNQDGTLNKTNTVVRAVEENAHNSASVLGMLEGGGYSSKAASLLVDYVDHKLHPEGNHLGQIKAPK
jgi:conjugal transfer mating pair stabilization protein TraG